MCRIIEHCPASKELCFFITDIIVPKLKYGCQLYTNDKLLPFVLDIIAFSFQSNP
jgi:hypothetical protein